MVSSTKEKLEILVNESNEKIVILRTTMLDSEKKLAYDKAEEEAKYYERKCNAKEIDTAKAKLQEAKMR